MATFSEAEAEAVFKAIDIDGSKFLSKSELQNYCASNAINWSSVYTALELATKNNISREVFLKAASEGKLGIFAQSGDHGLSARNLSSAAGGAASGGEVQYADYLRSHEKVFKFSVGDAYGPHRTMMTRHEREEPFNMSRDGWTQLLHFYAFDQPVTGTIRYTVGEAKGPHRIMVFDDIDMSDMNFIKTYKGWIHKLHFYAFPTKVQGTVKYAVGQARDPHRIMFREGGNDMDTEGWSQMLSFYAFPNGSDLTFLRMRSEAARRGKPW